MRYGDDAFYYISKKEQDRRNQLIRILLVLGMNVIVLLSLAFDFRWWEKYQIVFIALTIIYLLLLSTYEDSKGELFSDGLKRLRDKRDYFKGERLIVSNYDVEKNAPLFNGDYIFIWNNKTETYESEVGYFKFTASLDSSKKMIKVIDIVKNEPKYIIKEECSSDWNRMYKELEKKINEDGFTILRIYNKFGDVKWERSDEPTKPSKKRKIIYYVKVWAWYIAVIIAIFAPLIPAAIYLYKQ